MPELKLNRTGKSRLVFNGELIAFDRDGSNFENTAYSVYRTVSGNFVACLEMWNGRTSSDAPDGTMIRHAESVKSAEEAIHLFTHGQEISPTAVKILVEAGLITDDHIE